MSTLGVTCALLVALPLTFNAVFAALAATLDYPDVLPWTSCFRPSTATSASPSGELGYLLTGASSVLVGVAFTQTAVAPHWLGLPGVVVGALLVVNALEFVARSKETAGDSPEGSHPRPTSPGRCGSSPASCWPESGPAPARAPRRAGRQVTAYPASPERTRSARARMVTRWSIECF